MIEKIDFMENPRLKNARHACDLPSRDLIMALANKIDEIIDVVNSEKVVIPESIKVSYGE